MIDVLIGIACGAFITAMGCLFCASLAALRRTWRNR